MSTNSQPQTETDAEQSKDQTTTLFDSDFQQSESESDDTDPELSPECAESQDYHMPTGSSQAVSLLDEPAAAIKAIATPWQEHRSLLEKRSTSTTSGDDHDSETNVGIAEFELTIDRDRLDFISRSYAGAIDEAHLGINPNGIYVVGVDPANTMMLQTWLDGDDYALDSLDAEGAIAFDWNDIKSALANLSTTDKVTLTLEEDHGESNSKKDTDSKSESGPSTETDSDDQSADGETTEQAEGREQDETGGEGESESESGESKNGEQTDEKDDLSVSDQFTMTLSTAQAESQEISVMGKGETRRRPDLPGLQLTSFVKYPLQELNHIMGRYSEFTDHIEIKASENGIIFNGEGDTTTITSPTYEAGTEPVVADSDVQDIIACVTEGDASLFSIEYFKSFFRNIRKKHYGKGVLLKFGDEFPLKMDINISDRSYQTFMIAPRIQA